MTAVTPPGQTRRNARLLAPPATLPPHPVEVAGLMHELTAALLAATGMPDALDRLARFTATAVPAAARCSVVLIGEGEPLTCVAAGERGQALDDRQYTVGQGPGLDAARTRAMVTTHDLARDPRWPQLHDCARGERLHAVAALPLDVARASVGSLSLFAGRVHGLDADALVTALAIVNQAEVLLADLHRREIRCGADATVDRAAGVIIAQRGCGVADAYTVLEDTAHRLNLDRRAVAERLVRAAARNAGKPVDDDR